MPVRLKSRNFTPALTTEVGTSPSTDTDWVFRAFVDAGYSAYRIENSYGSLVNDAPGVVRELAHLTSPPRERLSDLLFFEVDESQVAPPQTRVSCEDAVTL